MGHHYFMDTGANILEPGALPWADRGRRDDNKLSVCIQNMRQVMCELPKLRELFSLLRLHL